MELLFPRAKKDVWERRRVVSVTAVGERSMRADEVRYRIRQEVDGLTEEEELEAEDEVERYVMGLCLGEEEERH